MALEYYYQQMSQYKDQECLKARTLHIKGVFPKDRTGEVLERYLNDILKSQTYGQSEIPGQVQSILVIPDYTKQLEIQSNIQDLKDFKMLLSVETPMCSCILPGKYTNQDKYERAMEKYEDKLELEAQKPFINSGNAFVCFDSVESMNRVIKHHKSTTVSGFKMFFISIGIKCQNLGRWITGKEQYEPLGGTRLVRSRSTF